MRRAGSDGDSRGDELPALGEELDFMRLLWAVDHGLQQRSKRMAAEIGLTGPQRLVIRIAVVSPVARPATSPPSCTSTRAP